MDLRTKFIISRWLYSIGEIPLLTDEEYNLIVETEKNNPLFKPYLQRTWSEDPCPTELLIENGLSQYIVDIEVDQTPSESIKAVTSLSELMEISNSLHNIPLHYSAKADGFSIQILYKDGKCVSVKSRGRNTDAIDFNNLISICPDIPEETGITKINAECVVPYDLFAIMQKEVDAKSIRASVRTAIVNKDYCKRLLLLAYEITTNGRYYRDTTEKFRTLRNWGFKTPEEFDLDSPLEVTELKGIRNNLEYQTDGVVLRSDDKLGNIKYALRFSEWEENTKISFIKDIEWVTGPVDGTFKANIEPININGTTYSTINIHNLATIIDAQLYRNGALLAFTIRSHAVPVLELDISRSLNKKTEKEKEEIRNKIKLENILK